MFKMLKFEILKTKRTYLLWALLGLWLIAFLWIFSGLKMSVKNIYNNNEIFLLIESFIIPMVVTIVSSDLINKEQNNRMDRILHSYYLPLDKLYNVKICYTLILLLLFVFSQYTIFLGIGLIQWKMQIIIRVSLCLVASLLAMIPLQLGLCLIAKKESTPLVIGLVFSFIALFFGGLNFRIIDLFFPWLFVKLSDPFTTGQVMELTSHFYLYIVYELIVAIVIYYLMKQKIQAEEVK